MNKLVLTISGVIFSCSLAFAGPSGYGGCPGPMMKGYGQAQYPIQNIGEAKAKDMIRQFLDSNNMKDYKIINIQKIQVPRGTAYYATIEGKNKQQYEIHVNPWGYVVGPFALPR
ncbi:hypothetical protein [Desulfurella multipotens]|uniref:hypothetical protein n=1 Tax=Desulfurella multipotens TaxID=79269 RepID=UPI000CC098B0|nr:hypothetical protein [Desulfurella multipotens]PMP63631.1 MAG: hypothetical protein C0192_07370 [Desulfurella multipotens]